MSFGDIEKISRPKSGDSIAIPIPEDYGRLNKRVVSSIQQISSNVIALQKFTGQLGTPKDTEEMRDNLSKVVERTRDLVQQTTKELHILSNQTNGDPQRKVQQGKLSRDFQEVLKKFNDVQKISAQKQREFLLKAKKQTESMKYEAAHLPDDDDDDDESGAILQSEQRRQQVMALESEIELKEAFIAEREDDIKDIESSIHQINEIFRDLSLMVQEQGEQLDTIEANISRVVDHTDGANTELKEAAKSQKKSRTKMCYILVCCLLVLVILILIIVFNLVK